MVAKRFVYLIVLGLAFHCEGDAKTKEYDHGKLIDASPVYFELPIPGSVLLPPPQVLIAYRFRIQVGDFIYFVTVPLCCQQQSVKAPYKLEWATNDPMEFRFDKGKMFVKRPNGKEFKARLLKVVRGVQNPSVSITSPPSLPEFPPELRQENHLKRLPLGIDFLHAENICLTVYGFVDAGDFFVGLHAHKSAKGIQFRKNNQHIETFPDAVTVSIIGVLGACSAEERAAQGGNVASSNFRFDEDFLKSVMFEASWKEGFNERAAELGPLVEGRIPSPTRLLSNRDWWEYQFKVQSRGVSLNDGLVIVMQSPDGKMVARLSARVLGTR